MPKKLEEKGSIFVPTGTDNKFPQGLNETFAVRIFQEIYGAAKSYPVPVKVEVYVFPLPHRKHHKSPLRGHRMKSVKAIPCVKCRQNLSLKQGAVSFVLNHHFCDSTTGASFCE